MKKLAALFLLIVTPAFADVSIRDGKFVFNGEVQELVIGESCFKLSNIITYHYTGQGSGKYSLGLAEAWVQSRLAIYGAHPVCRVFLETAGWNAHPMFGSEPSDQGFWNGSDWNEDRQRSNRDQLRDGNRQTRVDPTGQRVLEWFFENSERTGMAYELIIDATIKHDEIPKGEIDHVIRQVGVYMGQLAQQHPQALIIPNVRNEWNAHNEAGVTLADVNMWAVRWDRDSYWPGAAKIVDPGGGNTFSYDVGPEAGKYRAGMIHPDRGEGWETVPNAAQMARLEADARGMPVGMNESMLLCDQGDQDRCGEWYGARGWTADFTKYKAFVENAIARGVDYLIFHTEKGEQCDPDWPRPVTQFERWAAERFGGGIPPIDPPDPPDPPPAPSSVSYDHLIEELYQRILQRPADPEGMRVYNEWLTLCYEIGIGVCLARIEDVFVMSDEYQSKFSR